MVAIEEIEFLIDGDVNPSNLAKVGKKRGGSGFFSPDDQKIKFGAVVKIGLDETHRRDCVGFLRMMIEVIDGRWF